MSWKWEMSRNHDAKEKQKHSALYTTFPKYKHYAMWKLFDSDASIVYFWIFFRFCDRHDETGSNDLSSLP